MRDEQEGVFAAVTLVSALAVGGAIYSLVLGSAIVAAPEAVIVFGLLTALGGYGLRQSMRAREKTKSDADHVQEQSHVKSERKQEIQHRIEQWLKVLDYVSPNAHVVILEIVDGMSSTPSGFVAVGSCIEQISETSTEPPEWDYIGFFVEFRLTEEAQGGCEMVDAVLVKPGRAIFRQAVFNISVLSREGILVTLRKRFVSDIEHDAPLLR